MKVMPSASTIKAEMGLENGGKVHKYFTSRCYSHMGKFTPGGESGQLHRNVQLSTDEIAYMSPYAHYQWIGILYVDPETGSPFARKGVTKVPTSRNLKYHTIGTGRQWDSKMWSSNKDNVIKEVQEFVDKDGGL